GKFAFSDTFFKIVTNNIGVLILSFLFSFLFGAGAVFILAWNASILSAAIGMAAKSVGGLKGLPLAVMIFFPHGSLEILAYFIGGIAGGFVSVAITRRKSLGFWLVVKDSFKLMVVSILLLIIAGAIETIAIVM
ncbi:MAG: stage II sporulation protein M, partial [Methanosarcinales archaeon]